MASIHKVQRKAERGRERHSWLVRYRRPDRSMGSKTFKRKVDAERFAASIETDKSRDEYIDPRSGRVSAEEWAASWLETKTRTAPTTFADYESVVRHHVGPKLGHKQIRSVLPLDIERVLAQVPGDGPSGCAGSSR